MTRVSNPFANPVLDRMGEYRDDADWLQRERNASHTRFLCLDSEYRLAVQDDGITPWVLNAATKPADADSCLLGKDPTHTWFFIRHQKTMNNAPRWVGLRDAGSIMDALHAHLFAFARGLAWWQDSMRFCSACGGALQWEAAGFRARCTSCQHLHFPRTDPAIIVIVEQQGACLLGRQKHWPEGRYSTLAGFVEPGESLENAVCREVNEEAGVTVTHCRYHSSQPWPFPASLMLGFMAQAEDRSITLRDGELCDARWFTPDDIVEGVHTGQLKLSSPLSISWRLLADWIQMRAGVDLSRIVDSG